MVTWPLSWERMGASVCLAKAVAPGSPGGSDVDRVLKCLFSQFSWCTGDSARKPRVKGEVTVTYIQCSFFPSGALRPQRVAAAQADVCFKEEHIPPSPSHPSCIPELITATGLESELEMEDLLFLVSCSAFQLNSSFQLKQPHGQI